MKTERTYFRGTVITDNKLWPDTLVEVTGDTITCVEKYDGSLPKGEVINVPNGYICPGYIDSHIHGIDGFDFMDNSIESFLKIQHSLPIYGVTSFLATSRTETIPNIKRFLLNSSHSAIKTNSGAQLAGIHLEGPWINEQFKGAQKLEHILTPTLQGIRELFEIAPNLLKIVTLAPELPNSLEVIEFLEKHGIRTSAGHTAASFEEINKACELGLSRVTHCYNAMKSIHHRILTASFAALYLTDLQCEIIADGHHVHPKMIELLYKMKGPDHITLISDCTAANHIKDGSYEKIGGKVIFKQNVKVTLPDGTLAGSALTLDIAVAFAVTKCNIPIENAVQMATYNPAKAIGVEGRKGRLKKGYDADIIVLSSTFEVKYTMIAGKRVVTHLP
ncbi:N-acetylglucosamine-6-phosphate deacetylase [Bacillus infantis]|uniref:N-acetylglucosamine-6-phosphate deacetylase n=1 Tax=Bacillus infantis TaxID=324767 RepID=UPI003CE9F047